MASPYEVVEIDFLERRLLPDPVINEDEVMDDGMVLYDASFKGMEDNYVNYQTARWVLCSLLLIFAWGIGLVMFLYLPILRYVLRKEFKSRKLFVTSNSIVYKVTKPVVFPCLGVLKKEKYVLLPSVADVFVEQGYLQSLFGVYSIRIANSGVRRPTGDAVHIQGIAHATSFRKAVLIQVASIRGDSFLQRSSILEDPLTLGSRQSSSSLMPPPKSLRSDIPPPPSELILQKLDEVGISVKKLQQLLEKPSQSS